MKKMLIGFLAGITLSCLAFMHKEEVQSIIVKWKNAEMTKDDWGEIRTLYEGETEELKNLYTGYAIIAPGKEIHPPHKHIEEEFLIVTDGEGTFHLKGEEVKVKEGDMFFAKAWDIHGIKNTGGKDLKFFVMKYNAK